MDALYVFWKPGSTIGSIGVVFHSMLHCFSRILNTNDCGQEFEGCFRRYLQ
jgi:ClpP class serine protease